MKLLVKCPECKHKNKAPHSADNRIEYAKMYGDKFTLTCDNCEKKMNIT